MSSRIVAIVQARTGSTRLPGKVLKDLGGATVLARTINRLKRAATLDEIVIATTVEPADDSIVDEADRLGVLSFRGSEQDVLDRYHGAALARAAGVVVRVTSDCPLVDPTVADDVVRAFASAGVDYASNTLVRTYPRGLDVEVMSMEALARAWREAREPYQRAHVTPYFYQNAGLFRLLSVTADANYSNHRWTIDTPEDLEFVRAVYALAGWREDVAWKEILQIVALKPELTDVNRHIHQKGLEEG